MAFIISGLLGGTFFPFFIVFSKYSVDLNNGPFSHSNGEKVPSC